MRISILLVFWLFASHAFAVPAKRIKRTITLKDGTIKEVVLRGDEHLHYYEDAEGNAYTLSSVDSVLKACDERFVLADKKSLSSRWQEKMRMSNSRRINRAKKWGLLQEDGSLSVSQGASGGMRKSRWGAESNPVSGDKKGLVIMLNYSDTQMQSSHTQSFFNDYFNQEGFSGEGMCGSVHDYFKECSYGQFNVTFDVVGPVTVSKPLAYYGQNNSSGNDMHPGELVAEVCKLADELGVDFSKYDWDGDGEVEQVFLIYAGYGEAQSDIKNTIWPHEFSLDDCLYYNDGPGALTLDGVKVDTYAISCELSGSTGSVVNGIGTACHEFSHCLCLPDMYSRSSTSFGMDDWDIMDSGTYSGPTRDGTCPTAYTSYERMYCGWLKPVELSTPCQINDMKDIVSAPEAYIIYNQNNKCEYYLLENRQQVGFNKYDKGHGLLVLHVDYDEYAWLTNTVNDVASRQRMTIIPADNSLSRYSLPGDTWPGTKNNTALTDTSTPAAKLYNANADGRKYMGKPIEHISESNEGTISFAFDGGEKVEIETPVAYEASDVASDAFTASWSHVDGATGYEVELSALDNRAEVKCLLSEDFSKFNNGLTSDGTIDVSGSMDAYTNVSGWTGFKIYRTSGDEIKLGSSKSSGNVTTPPFTASDGHVSIVLGYRNYGSDNGNIDVKINGDIVLSITPQDETEDTLIVVEGKDEMKLTLSTTRRAYISKVEVYDGELSEEDLMYFNSQYKVKSINKYKTNNESYTFNNLESSLNYSYRVRAYVDDAASEWSNSVAVELSEATGMGAVAESSDIIIGVNIYDLFGRRVDKVSKQGVYLMNGKKILLK